MKKISFSTLLICFTCLMNINLMAAQVNIPSPLQNAQGAKNKYPVVDYDAPEPTDAKIGKKEGVKINVMTHTDLWL